MKCIGILCVFLFAALIGNASGINCEEENKFGFTVTKSCPGPLDRSRAIYCCGPKGDRKCCETLLGLNDEDLDKIAEYVPTLIGVVIAIIFGSIVCCLVCCCCCPFCLLHKKRNRGIIHQPATERSNPVSMQAPTQPSYAPVQAGPYPTQQQTPYPTQPAGYPNQPAPYPTQPTGYPGQAVPPYPTQAPAPGFVAPPMTGGIQMQQYAGDQPPPYSEKQQAYNPNY